MTDHAEEQGEGYRARRDREDAEEEQAAADRTRRDEARTTRAMRHVRKGLKELDDGNPDLAKWELLAALVESNHATQEEQERLLSMLAGKKEATA